MHKSTPSLPQAAVLPTEQTGPVELDAGLLDFVAGGANPRSGGWNVAMANPRSGGWANPRSGGWSAANPRSGGW